MKPGWVQAPPYRNNPMPQFTIELSEEAIALLAERALRRGREAEEYGTLVMQQALLLGDRDEADELFTLQHFFQAMGDFLQLCLEHPDLRSEDRETFVACLQSSQKEWQRIQYLGELALSTSFETVLVSQVWNRMPWLYPEVYELRPLVQSVMATCERSTYRLPSHTLRYTVDADVPEKLDGDVQKVEQVLFSVIGNALRFSPDGGRVQLHVGRQVGDKVRFTIQDEGIGMDAVSLAKFGTKFFRASDDKPHGTGVGAFLAKKFVELHTGEMQVASEGLGRGTTVSFTLPSHLTTRRAPAFVQAIEGLRRWRITLSALLAEIEALPRTRYYFDTNARADFAQLVHTELEQMQAFLAQLESSHAADHD